MRTTVRQRGIRASLVLVGAVLLLVGYLILWQWTGIGFPCIFYELTGLPCPGCGISRALLSLLRLDVLTALRYHPIVLLVVGYVGWLVGTKTYGYVSGRKDLWDLRPYWVHVAFLSIFLGFGILRVAWILVHVI